MDGHRPASAPIGDVACWNDGLAREHDIDQYYARSSFVIRAIEQRRLRLVRALAAVQPGQRLLEVGCGGGHVLRLFPEAELTGVDVSSVMLDKARRNTAGLRVTLLQGELCALALPSASFDRVVCTEVLEHVVDPTALLAELGRVLRPDGIAVITFPNDRLIGRIKGVVRHSGLHHLPPLRRISWGGDRYHLHVWSLAQMRQLLGVHFRIEAERFAPHRLAPIRCCFRCRPG